MHLIINILLKSDYYVCHMQGRNGVQTLISVTLLYVKSRSVMRRYKQADPYNALYKQTSLNVLLFYVLIFFTKAHRMSPSGPVLSENDCNWMHILCQTVLSPAKYWTKSDVPLQKKKNTISRPRFPVKCVNKINVLKYLNVQNINIY